MMEEKELCLKQTTTTATTTALGVQKDSQTISKFIRPKIRIIHIYAPEVIQTDAGNFRELVQRLTGMPPEENCSHSTRKKSRRHGNLNRCMSSASVVPMSLKSKKMEVMRGAGLNLNCLERMKLGDHKDDEIWSGANSGGGFLGGFGEIEGFMDQINNNNNNYHGFPLMLPAATATAAASSAASQYMDGYGESLCSLHN